MCIVWYLTVRFCLVVRTIVFEQTLNQMWIVSRYHRQIYHAVHRNSLRSFSSDSKSKLIKTMLEKHTPHAIPVTSKLDPDIADAVACIEERQEQRSLPGIVAIEKTKCKHGYPRAYMVR